MCGRQDVKGKPHDLTLIQNPSKDTQQTHPTVPGLKSFITDFLLTTGILFFFPFHLPDGKNNNVFYNFIGGIICNNVHGV